ncbi:hypothetical protein LBMAG42_37540 [Deltaproteobacteria bacterium]|nr:hypothetical protein LBMAG42_37540 [Deltaproteobacteria bacterium]
MNRTELTANQLAILAEVDGRGVVSGEALEMRLLGAAIREAQAAELATHAEIDVADDVMLAVAINAAVAGEIDVADDVMLAVALNAAVAGEIDVADDVMLAVALNAAVAGEIDVADDVMLAVALNAAVAGEIDVADDVMAAIRAPAAPVVVPIRAAAAPVAPAGGGMPRWVSLGGLGAALAMAAAALFALNSPVVTTPVELHQTVAEPAIVLTAFNEAEVEAIEAPDSTSVSVMQFDEGGPTIIFIADAEG